jgi:hypothetical protein
MNTQILPCMHAISRTPQHQVPPQQPSRYRLSRRHVGRASHGKPLVEQQRIDQNRIVGVHRSSYDTSASRGLRFVSRIVGNSETDARRGLDEESVAQLRTASTLLG